MDGGVIHDHGDDEIDPITSTAAFAHFQEGMRIAAGAVDQQKATLVGAYINTIDSARLAG